MRIVCLLLFFLILGTQAAGAQSVITVEVHENGNALWTMEKRLPLPNQTDIQDWEEFIKADQTENQQDIENFRKSIEVFVVSAMEFSGRPMKLENVKISYDTAKSPSGAYGIIRYNFEWVNFSRKEKDKILIGDAFSEGMVLSQENVLVLKIPDGFDVESASPNFDKRDGNRLIWDGTLYRSFGKGEPAVVLVHPGISPWYLIVILLVVASGAFFMFTKRRSKPDTQSDPVSLENIAIEELKYEEKIERFLLRSGGQASQSDIIKELGLSKSRVSTILSQMKEKGQIIKIKNGSGNLIRIVKK
ncbi:MAG: winged helix-turn-helix transcriptional regulator [Candidatus Methanoperedens sp.]|nr:winged helix-turn-helix transcriptional regulator [Candidatus Methanoperedens sp.]